MKKIFVLLVAVFTMGTFNVFASSTEISSTAQPECKRVGNVDVSLHYYYGGKEVRALAHNYNNYRVTIRYTIHASNGTNTYTIDSGLLSISACSDNGAGFAQGPMIKVPDGYSCYLSVENPEFCN